MPRLSRFNGAEIFLDANILLYHFTSHPQFGLSCHQLIQSTEVGMIDSFTSNWVITEVVHKLMMLEACDRFHIQSYDVITYLKKQPREIKKLSKYRKALALIYKLPNLTVLEVDSSIFRQSHTLILKYQLLSSDAIHVSTCLAYGIKHVATNDRDFLRVKGLTIWLP